MSKITLIAVLVVVVLAGAGLLMLAVRPTPVMVPPIVLPIPAPDTVVRPFTLTAHTGKPFSDTDMRGKVGLIYFGYTFCPDVCPTELGYLAKVLRALGTRAAQVVPVFITVDPQRDTREKLAEYVPLFDQRLIGLTGSTGDIDALAKAYGVFHQRANVVTKQADYYLIDHSSSIFIIDPMGHLVETLDSDTSLTTAVSRITSLLPSKE